jgi:hypothetical protein
MTWLQLRSRLTGSSIHVVISSRRNPLRTMSHWQVGPVEIRSTCRGLLRTCVHVRNEMSSSTSPNSTKLTGQNCEAWSDHERLKCLDVAAGGCLLSSSWCLGGRSNKNEDAVMQETETSAATDSLPSGGLQKERQYSSSSCEWCDLKFLGAANTECFKLMLWGYKQVQSCLDSGVIRMAGNFFRETMPFLLGLTFLTSLLANGQSLNMWSQPAAQYDLEHTRFMPVRCYEQNKIATPSNHIM